MIEVNNTKPKGKKLRGRVVSDKLDKTVIVSVERFTRHPKYGKYMKRQKRYKAHDEKNSSKIGDMVTIQEGKPISKDKKFTVIL